ncbi:MAG TPA: DinB family protein, partial [Gemmatimonadales bacterium]|nr:DinB family protein [Gemmatimonadales bacterium]
MKTHSILSLALVCLACSKSAEPASRAQGGSTAAPSPVSEALRRTRERSGKNLVDAAEAMPEAKYGFKPTPAQMSFGDILVHLAEGNDFLCSAVAGTTAPKRSEVKVEAGKEKLIARLRET